jgi:hypothetical protein
MVCFSNRTACRIESEQRRGHGARLFEAGCSVQRAANFYHQQEVVNAGSILNMLMPRADGEFDRPLAMFRPKKDDQPPCCQKRSLKPVLKRPISRLGRSFGFPGCLPVVSALGKTSE